MNFRRTACSLLLPLFFAINVAKADELPSPCGPGELGDGTNCMYLVASGNTYEPASGDRAVTDTGLMVAIEVWLNFAEITSIGGGFDITYYNALVDTASWQWSPEFASSASLNGGPGPTGWEGIQFDDFFGPGFGGPDPMFVGTLTVSIAMPGSVFFAIEQPYSTNTFPNCFAAIGMPTCVPTNFYALDLSTGAEVDTDGDGITDSNDNCIDIANPDQRDADADGFGSVCDADFDDSCLVNFADLSIMSDNFFSSDAETDMDGSGTVNFADLSLLSDQFFQPPGPSAFAICED